MYLWLLLKGTSNKALYTKHCRLLGLANSTCPSEFFMEFRRKACLHFVTCQQDDNWTTSGRRLRHYRIHQCCNSCPLVELTLQTLSSLYSYFGLLVLDDMCTGLTINSKLLLTTNVV